MFKARVAFLSVIAFIFVHSISAYAVTLREAEDVFNNYDKEISNLQRSIDMFNQVITESKDNSTIYQAYVGQARAYETMGDQAKLTQTSAFNDYEQGMAMAKKAIQVNPKGAMGYYWYAANLGRKTEVQGVLNSLISLPEFKKNLGKAYELDKTNPDILEVYGEMYYELQWVVSDSNGKAMDFINRSLKSNPHLTLAMVIKGKILIREGKYQQARKVLTEAINFKTPLYRADWAMYDRPLAQKLLDSIKDK
jgi:tetratricopeptide (TPR) repeat protein